jgi:hypothetical protein
VSLLEFGHRVMVNTLLLLLPPYWFVEMGHAQTMCKPDKFFTNNYMLKLWKIWGVPKPIFAAKGQSAKSESNHQYSIEHCMNSCCKSVHVILDFVMLDNTFTNLFCIPSDWFFGQILRQTTIFSVWGFRDRSVTAMSSKKCTTAMALSHPWLSDPVL